VKSSKTCLTELQTSSEAPDDSSRRFTGTIPSVVFYRIERIKLPAIETA
jgi:hypothetical protein